MKAISLLEFHCWNHSSPDGGLTASYAVILKRFSEVWVYICLDHLCHCDKAPKFCSLAHHIIFFSVRLLSYGIKWMVDRVIAHKLRFLFFHVLSWRSFYLFVFKIHCFLVINMGVEDISLTGKSYGIIKWLGCSNNGITEHEDYFESGAIKFTWVHRNLNLLI